MLLAVEIFPFASPLRSAKLKPRQPVCAVIGLGLLILISFMLDKYMCNIRKSVFPHKY